jgi:hypothetical protein
MPERNPKTTHQTFMLFREFNASLCKATVECELLNLRQHQPGITEKHATNAELKPATFSN